MVEFNFPKTALAIGAMAFSIASWVKDSEMFKAFNPKSILNFGVFSLVDTMPLKAICPPKTFIFKLLNVTASSLMAKFPEASFKFKLS